MNASELKDKITGALKGFSIEKALEFVRKNVRYFSAGALFVSLVLILANCTGAPNEDNGSGTEASTEPVAVVQEYQVDAIQKINELISNYYAAYADGNIDELKKIAMPITANEESYINMFSEYVDSYENIKCYTKPGLDDKSYLVSPYIEIKFKDVDTLAPGLDFFYVSTNEDGELYIDNLYSQFNLQNEENQLDATVKALIDNFELEKDVVDLQKEVQQKYDEAVNSDEKLADMVNATIKEARSAWAQEIAQREPEQSTEQSTEPSTEQTPKEDEKPQVIEQQAEIVYTTDIVNMRKEPNENGELIDTLPLGTALTRVATTADGWSKLDYNNKECYVKSDYLSTEQPQIPEESQEPQQSASGIAEGTEVLLSDTVNVRASMSETADKVGTAFAGEKVTVIMSYAEGWTKVNWNGTTGYIKTEFLK